MNKSILLSIFILLFFLDSCEQAKKPATHEPGNNAIHFDSAAFNKIYEDLNSLRANSGDSLFINLNKARYDTLLKNLVAKEKLQNENRSASSEYKIILPAVVPIGWTNDFENILTTEQVDYLDSILSGYEKETSNEIVIVTLDSSSFSNQIFHQFTLELANDWGVGKKEKNNGVLIAICAGMHKIRIQNGYGIERILSNDETKKIIDEGMLPECRNGNYFEALKKGLAAIISGLK